MKEVNNMKLFIAFSVFLVLGLSYLSWLNDGCELNGVMTIEGRVCAEDLLSYGTENN